MLTASPSASELLASKVDAVMSMLPPSSTVAVSSAAMGASLRSLTARAKSVMADAGGSPSSVAVTRMVSVVGVSGSKGVPLNVRVVGLKRSHAGSDPPSARVAV